MVPWMELWAGRGRAGIGIINRQNHWKQSCWSRAGPGPVPAARLRLHCSLLPGTRNWNTLDGETLEKLRQIMKRLITRINKAWNEWWESNGEGLSGHRHLRRLPCDALHLRHDRLHRHQEEAEEGSETQGADPPGSCPRGYWFQIVKVTWKLARTCSVNPSFK